MNQSLRVKFYFSHLKNPTIQRNFAQDKYLSFENPYEPSFVFDETIELCMQDREFISKESLFLSDYLDIAKSIDSVLNFKVSPSDF